MFHLSFLWQDLVKSTPTSHADYDMLQKALSSAQYFIEHFDGTSYKDSVSDISCASYDYRNL